MIEDNKKKIQIPLLVGALALVAIIAFVKLHTSQKMSSESALIDELRTVRTAVQLFVVLNKKFPSDLVTLTSQKYIVGNRSGHYLTGVSTDSAGYPVDSFGFRFQYDSNNGRVWSGNVEYANW